MKIALVCFDDFTDLDLFLPWDVLNRVRLVGGLDDWDVRILGTEDSHVSMAGLRIPTHGRIEEANSSDAVLFSSGKGVQKLYQNSHYLKRFQLNPEKQLIGSMCSGALLLGAMGLLTGKQATTYPTAVHQLAELGVEIVNKSFVNVGNISTAAGCLAGQELAAWLIDSLIGADMTAKVMESVQPVGKGLSLPDTVTLRSGAGGSA
ncbi:DJ-1/PfpI family protein [Paenibacillus thiaminolyticus]|uniref:DJ-1/PfpI family protein n=1 Tax=Paenibacillus thiaminolyticus TaxID=49283 RepID=A0AAP9DZP0_PANTH|nr:DJ-1/PfpI family protein [Paenibacillus thiaminolyticus]MCY9538468.1 DJ-1/PfpI family protein [Paenibacillus thiaminolyticus]MCY9601205.1 DJ-1/PfpI family protein [Paenibacillus thiaminolyticus]MCY9605867.1 DJ-1/PfpI family protein [Paenibacillus thiaminolyticus]MCY9611254.1 DJ-1/PfpI family protein [Paenibacillus thiaminolyticus]MCY9617483.1 DJ-1/PfpI family protein [Paenibacillus thiaminolyticus]